MALNLISPDEFKKRNSGGSSTTLPKVAETPGSSMQLISPSEFKAKLSAPAPPPSPDPATVKGKQLLDTLMPGLRAMQNPQPAAPSPPSEPVPGGLGRLMQSRDALNQAVKATSGQNQPAPKKSLLRRIGQGLADFPNAFLNTASFGLSDAYSRLLGNETREEQETRDARIGGKIGEFAGYIAPGGAADAAASVLVRPLVKNLPNIAKGAIRLGAGGTLFGAAEEASEALTGENDQSLGQRAADVAISGAVGAGLGAAGPALSSAARKVAEGVRARRAAKAMSTAAPAAGEGLSGEVAALPAGTTANGRPLLDRGLGGVGEAVAAKVTGRSDIIADLSKGLRIPIRTGRYRVKAHGVFKIKPGVVRSKLTNDLPTISHEIGHALDKRYKLSTPLHDQELMALGEKTSGPNYSKNQVRNEGVAEFFRLMLTDPDAAKMYAPKFYERYMKLVSKADKAVLATAQQRIRQYIDQDIITKSFSEMSVGKRDKRKLPSLDELYTKFVDELHPIKQLLKPLGDKGREIFEKFWLLRGATGRAQAFLRHGRPGHRYNVAGKSLEEILGPVRTNLNEFRAYIKDKRALELAEREIMTGSDLKPEERLAGLRALEERYPHFKAAHAELKEYQDALLDELIEAGVLDADDVHAFKELNKEYVPFFRVYEAEVGSGQTKGGRTNVGQGAANQNSPIKRIKGSDRDIVDPLESIIKNTYQYVTIAERNKAMRELVDAVTQAEDLGHLVEKIPAPMQGKSFSLEELRKTLERAGADPESMDMDTIVSIFRPVNVAPGKENVVSVFRDGKREFYQLDPDLYRAVTAADREQMHMIVRALNFPVRILRSGIVNTLEFWLRNLFRDQFSAMVNSKNGYIPYLDMVRGMYHVLGKSDVFTKFLASGGAQGLRTSLDRRYLQTDLRNILATSMKDKGMNVLRNPLEAMRVLSEISELGTRVGEFAKGVKKDGTPKGVRAAALSARDLIDYGRAGTWGRDINKVSAFWNAQVQGLDKTIRTFTNPKTAPKALAKSLAVITAPTAALYAVNRNDPRYQELPQWDKDLFWHLWIGDNHFRVPIPFELGVLFKVVPERLLGYATGEEEPLRNLGSTVKDAVPVPMSIPDAVGFITALAPIAQVMANQTFNGAPIVPRREEDLLPEDQAGPYTSNVAKTIAKGASHVGLGESTIGSPRKIDHIIRGYTGSLGQYGTQLIDQVTNATGLTSSVPKPSAGLVDKPLFKAVMGGEFSSGGTNSIDRFYDRLDKLTQQSQSSKKSNQPFEDEGELKRLQQIQRLIGDVSRQIRAVESDPEMKPKEKADEIRRLNVMANNFARLGLGLDQLEYEDVFK